MARRRNRYKEMERYMTYTLLFDVFMFILFLIYSGIGVIWVKVVTSIVAIATGLLCLGFLYLNREILRSRSLWMTVTAVSIIVCTVFSLILGYPSPNPLA